MPRAGPLAVVITGASSGLGRATALAFAATGASLFLIARGERELAAAASECRSLGAPTLFRSVDVTDYVAVEAACAAAVEAFGPIDMWINNAAVLLLGPFEELPPEAFRRVIETNLFGCANGARAAIKQFKAQGGRGTLVNVSSVLGKVGEPYVSGYVASKFAIRGFSACLRQEVRNTPGIHVCTVLPGPLDTPMYQHAGNYMGRCARSIFPVYDVRRTADVIVRLAQRPRREVVVTAFGRLVALGLRLTPGLVEWAVAKAGPRLQFAPEPHPSGSGNVFASLPGHHASTGGWREYWRACLLGARVNRESESGARDSNSSRSTETHP